MDAYNDLRILSILSLSLKWLFSILSTASILFAWPENECQWLINEKTSSLFPVYIGLHKSLWSHKTLVPFWTYWIIRQIKKPKAVEYCLLAFYAVSYFTHSLIQTTLPSVHIVQTLKEVVFIVGFKQGR